MGSLSSVSKQRRLLWQWTKLYLQRSSWLYQRVMEWKSRYAPPLLVVKGVTRIVIEAFPRSGNSFSVRLFRCANPDVDADRISHHSHIISNVKHAAKWGIPAVIVIRNPVDAIASNMLAVDDTSDAMGRFLARKYLDFYEWVEKNREEVVLLRFEEMTNGRFKRASQQINERFGTDFRTDFDEAELAEAAREAIEQGSPHRKNDARVPIPTDFRSGIYAELKPRVAANPAIHEAIALYERLIATCSDEPPKPEVPRGV
jgi:hypothetical protein